MQPYVVVFVYTALSGAVWGTVAAGAKEPPPGGEGYFRLAADGRMEAVCPTFFIDAEL